MPSSNSTKFLESHMQSMNLGYQMPSIGPGAKEPTMAPVPIKQSKMDRLRHGCLLILIIAERQC